MNRQEQLKRLGGGLQNFLTPTFVCFVALGLLLGADNEFRKTTPPSINWDGSVMLFAGILFVVMLVIFPTVERLDVEKRLSHALNLLEELTVQEEVNHRLRHYARLTADANRLQVEAQNELSLARTEEEEAELREREESAKDFFESCSKPFYDLCLWAESAGYNVLKTSKGRFSFRLYIPPKQETPPASTPLSEGEVADGPWEDDLTRQGVPQSGFNAGAESWLK